MGLARKTHILPEQSIVIQITGPVSGFGGVVVMSMARQNGIRELARKARRGEELSDQEQGRLCLMCVSTGDARWWNAQIRCKRSKCKYRSSRSSRYFRERVSPILSDTKQSPPNRGKISPGGDAR